MRFGFRKPSFNKSFKARTTGRLKRTYKRALNPWYGRKGMGYLHNPGKAIYNGIYHRTTVSPIPRSKTKAYRHAYYMKRKYGYVPSDTDEESYQSKPQLSQKDINLLHKFKRYKANAEILKQDEMTPTTSENKPIKDLHILDAAEPNTFKDLMSVIIAKIDVPDKYTKWNELKQPNPDNIDEICLRTDGDKECWQFDLATGETVPYSDINDVIRNSYGIYRALYSNILTNGYFDTDTRQFCHKMNIKYPDMPIKLYDRDDLKKILAKFEPSWHQMMERNIKRGYTSEDLLHPLKSLRDTIIQTANKLN